MNKLLTTISLLCLSVAACAESYVCSYRNYMHTYERNGQIFIKTTAANFDDLNLPPTILGPDTWDIEVDNSEWLILSLISLEDSGLGGALVRTTIINKATGKYVSDSVRSIEFEAVKESGNCAVL